MERSFDLTKKFRVIFNVLVFCLAAVIASPAQTLTTLVSFDGANGANPDYVSLVQGSDGNLYGTTLNRGQYGGGTVFKITLTGALTTLYSFCVQSGCPDGEQPAAGLVQGIDGNFYGTTEYGGAPANAGTVFKITPTGTINPLYSFCTQGGGCTDGANPVAELVQATDGNFYGTTLRGGDHGSGTVFQITPTGTLTPLYSFCAQGGGNCTDGGSPYAGLVQGTDGNFYGTTQVGGTNGGYGTVFKVTSTGTLTPLYSFSSLDGAYPYAKLVQGTDGNFYGTTQLGGSNNDGEVFKITPSGTLTKLYSLCSLNGCADGTQPFGGLVQATDGNFYGTTSAGGASNNGTVFQVTPAGALRPLYSFSGPDGASPNGGLLQAMDGNFYGTTYYGGINNLGTVFSLVPDYVLAVSVTGSGTVTSTDGFISCPGMCYRSYPNNTPVMLNATPASGWIFAGWSGACSGTGPCNITMTQNLSVTATFTQQDYQLTVSTSGSGTVASMDGGINCPSTCGNSYPVNTPVTLNATPAPGWSFAGWGGACSGNGSCNVTMTQNQSVTATFTQNPNFFNLTVSISGAGTVTSTDGFINCPGTCSYTYPSNTQVTLNESPGQQGTFSGWSGACTGTGPCNLTMTQNLSVTATFTGQQDMVLHSFGNARNDGQNPTANLISGAAGKLYGTTSAGGVYGKGTIFELLPNGTETVLYNFAPPNSNDGQNPLGNLIFDSAGNLYGTTSAGGVYGNGTIFELSPNGTETVLYNFGNGGDGQNPSAGLVFDTSGNLYGTTYGGGTFGYGTAFGLSPNGAGGWTETVLYSFGNGNDGQNPYAGLVFDTSGNLYGTTVNGGAYGGGTAFELSPNSAGIGCCRESLVYSFGNANDGSNPYAGLVFDTSSNLYGTTVNGGAYGGGTVFELSPGSAGIGCCRESMVYNLGSGNDGRVPSAGLIFDTSGNLYGTTQNGGLYSGRGTVFELSPNGTETVLYNFGNGSDGRNPSAGLIFTSGSLYGTTVNGGAYGGGTVFGIMPGPSPLQFVAVTPCRLVDTRNPDGTFGGPPVNGGTVRSFPLEQSGNPCNLPSNVLAYSLNVTVVPQHTLGYLTIWPTGEDQPVVSTLNSLDGRIKANAAIVPAGTPSGSVSVYVTDTTNVIVDIDGYFTAPGSQTLQFYALTPCRVADTRKSNFPQGLGLPHLSGKVARDFPVLESSCIPTGITPAAYSFNFTAVPYPSLGDPLGYLELWPTGQQPQNPVSTLNNVKGTYVANAAIVPAGTSGEITAYASNDTDLVIDIDGYFAPAGSGGLSLYPMAPCRVIDTRKIGNGQPFSGTLSPPVNVVGSVCAPPSSALAYVFNATVVPSGSLGYLTLWPDGETQPVVSTLNAADGWITSNMAIVPTSNGQVDAYANGITHLILDLSGYFAP